MSSFLGTFEVGIYQSILKLLYPINFLTTPLNSLYHSRIIELYDKSSIQLRKLIQRITIRVFMSGIIIFMLLWFFLPFYLKINGAVQPTYSYNLIYLGLGTLSILPLITWWGGSFILCYNPNIPIYSNSLASLVNIILPILSLKFLENSLVTFTYSLVFARLFTWPIIIFSYYNYLKNS